MKNRLLTFFTLLCVVHIGLAAERVRDYPVDHIAPNTYVIHGPLELRKNRVIGVFDLR